MRRIQQLMNTNKNKLQIHHAFTFKSFKSKNTFGGINCLNDLANNDITTVYVAAIVDDFDVQEFINDQSNLGKLEYKDGQWHEIDENTEPLEYSVKHWSLDNDDIILLLY